MKAFFCFIYTIQELSMWSDCFISSHIRFYHLPIHRSLLRRRCAGGDGCRGSPRSCRRGSGRCPPAARLLLRPRLSLEEGDGGRGGAQFATPPSGGRGRCLGLLLARRAVARVRVTGGRGLGSSAVVAGADGERDGRREARQRQRVHGVFPASSALDRGLKPTERNRRGAADIRSRSHRAMPGLSAPARGWGWTASICDSKWRPRPNHRLIVRSAPTLLGPHSVGTTGCVLIEHPAGLGEKKSPSSVFINVS